MANSPYKKIRSRDGRSARFLHYDNVIVEYRKQIDDNWLIMFGEHDAPMKLVSTKQEADEILNDVSEKFKAFAKSSDLIDKMRDKLNEEEYNNTQRYDEYLASVGSPQAGQ